MNAVIELATIKMTAQIDEANRFLQGVAHPTAR